MKPVKKTVQQPAKDNTTPKISFNETFFRALIEHNTNAITLLNSEGKVIYDSPAASGMLGYSPTEWIGKNVFELVHPDDLQEVQTLFAHLLKTKEGQANQIFRVRHKDNHWVWLDVVATNLLAQPSVKAIVINYRDVTELKQVQETLSQSEERFSKAFLSSPAGLVISSLVDGKLIEANEAYLRMIEYKREEVIGRTTTELNITSITQRKRLIERLREKGELLNFEMQLQTKSGKLVEMLFSSLQIELDGVPHLLSTTIDITERKRAEEALSLTEKRLRALIENSWDAIALFGADGTILYGSPSTVQILGYSLDEFIGRNAFELIHEEDQAFITESLNLSLQQPRMHIPMYARIRHKNGEWRWLEGVFTNLLDEPSVQAIVNNYHDFTERKQAEEALSNNQLYMRNTLDSALDAFLTMNDEGIILGWNRQSENIFGWTAEEAIGKTMAEMIIPPIHRQAHTRGLKHFLNTGEGPVLNKMIEISALHRDGREFPVELSITPIEQAGRFTFSAFIRDITERKQAEAAVRESEEQFRSLFEDSPIALWVEDFSGVKKLLDQLKQKNVTDIPAYMREHPEFVTDCANLVQILDVNRAAIKLYGANDKADLMVKLANLVSISLSQIEYELIQLAKGQLNFEREGIDQTLTGEKIFVHIHWSVVPGFEDSLERVIVSTVDVTERKRGEQRIHHQVQRLNALRSIDFAISNSFDMKSSLRVLLNGTKSQLDVDAAAILLFNPAIATLEYAAGEGFDFSAIQESKLKLGDGLAGQAALERRMIHTNQLAHPDSGFLGTKILDEEGFVSYYALPLISKSELKGVLEIFHREELHPDKEWLDFLETLAGQAAIAIDNAQLFEGMQRSNLELNSAYDATIEGWSAALDLRDKETEGHSQRVTEMTVKLSRKMGIPESELVQIRRGALLHDIGKLGIPDYILLKPDKLTKEEWEIMQKHPAYAYDMLSSISYLRYALEIPYCHHEKWDGSGYPRQLKGEAIPLAARIFAIVDVWDALNTDRPYRPAWTRERTLEHIKEQAGTHFDPQVVEAFFKMINNE